MEGALAFRQQKAVLLRPFSERACPSLHLVRAVCAAVSQLENEHGVLISLPRVDCRSSSIG